MSELTITNRLKLKSICMKLTCMCTVALYECWIRENYQFVFICVVCMFIYLYVFFENFVLNIDINFS